MTDFTQASGPRPSDRFIPWYFVAFFVVVIAVNAMFLMFALDSHSGVVRDDAYRHGLAYNDIIAADEAQKRLGWTARVDLMDGHRVAFELLDANGQPMEGADVRLRARFTAQDGADITMFMRPLGHGRYAAEPTWSRIGQYDVFVDVTWDQQVYQHRDRLTVRTLSD